jgi:hypothetical protein
LPDRSADHVLAQVAHPRGSRSLSAHLKSRLGLDGIKMALLNELLDKPTLHDALRLAAAIKALPVRVVAPRPIDEAISTAQDHRQRARRVNRIVFNEFHFLYPMLRNRSTMP